ncbi:glyoxalase [Mycolicibacterium bacteremicum]|uniref:glyoxalase n=1 Tax=Mycolicibacterium bacteremicum TaxID=564198 RepID=UPI0026E9595B|nr:glyoxalase [Mycolicibacterium bacteremicum]
MPAATVPLLPCATPAQTIEFYDALGFDVSDQQTKPYLYLAFGFDGIELHFKEAAPSLEVGDELTGGCLMFVDDVADHHASFSDRLRRHYGRIPFRGLPRIERLRPGQSRFQILDPSGNCLVFINRGESDIEYGGAADLSGLAKAHDNVRIFRDFKSDDALAARALDAALRRYRDEAPRMDLARAWADRIELAVALADPDAERLAANELADLDLTDAERNAIADELTAITELRQWLA